MCRAPSQRWVSFYFAIFFIHKFSRTSVASAKIFNFHSYSYRLTLQEPEKKMPLTRAEIRPVRPPHYADTFAGTYIISVSLYPSSFYPFYPSILYILKFQGRSGKCRRDGNISIGLTENASPNSRRSSQCGRQSHGKSAAMNSFNRVSLSYFKSTLSYQSARCWS